MTSPPPLLPDPPRPWNTRTDDDPMLAMLLEALDHPALVLDAHQRVIQLNRPAAGFLGLDPAKPIQPASPGEVLGCLWATPHGCGSRTECQPCGLQHCLANLPTGISSESLLSLRPGSGSKGLLGEFRFRACPVPVTGPARTLLTFQNLGDRKRLDALERFLFHQIQGLIDGLDGTLRILAAHPADGPMLLGQLMDFSQQLSQELQGQRILVQAENGTLDIAPRDTHLQDLADSLSAFFRNHDTAHKRHLVIGPFPSACLHTDPALLLRILVDLTLNALEATPITGTVRIQHAWIEGFHRFCVWNPGGMPSSVADRIFQRAFSTKPTGGAGLGTFGLRLLAEHYLGGRLGFTTSEDTGTCFTLELPCPEGSQGAEEAVPLVAQGQGPGPLPCPKRLGTVLVVDDTKVTRHLLRSILSRDFQVLMADSGPEALRICAETLPDLVVLDVLMPGMDGYEVCRALKADPHTAGIPILFLTSLMGKGSETQALEAGAIDFVSKPINPDVLHARVKNHVEMKRNQNNLEDLTLLDELTGIANRRAFDRCLGREWRRGLRSQKPLGLIMGDVDQFKRYNDGMGHLQGDACLRAVAQVFAEAMRRPTDLAARYGGEEFACVLAETDLPGVFQVAEAIRARVEALAQPHPDSDVSRVVTLSLGLAAMVPGPGTGITDLMMTADRNLYEAKKAGRNRVIGPQ